MSIFAKANAAAYRLHVSEQEPIIRVYNNFILLICLLFLKHDRGTRSAQALFHVSKYTLFLKHDRGTRSAQALFHVSKYTLFLTYSTKITFFVYFRNITQRNDTKLPTVFCTIATVFCTIAHQFFYFILKSWTYKDYRMTSFNGLQ